MSSSKVDILGIQFINSSLVDIMKLLNNHIQKKEKAFVVTANPEIVVHSHRDQNYRKLINTATYITPDGTGIVKASRFLNQPICERVTGFDIFMNALQVADEKQWCVYFLGAKDAVLNRTLETVKQLYPSLKTVGAHHGYFGLDDEHIIEDIRQAQPDFIFVAMGFPRQEQWIARHISKFEKGVFIGVGGCFDVLSGTTKRAPQIWQKLNIEWLYRLLQQPQRGRRMMALPLFALKILKQKAKMLK
ncbi:WecB/TagA/CpsF family glycosyltransferase [Tuberibacillus sp. Marseille-P3662]|uniref:WecB/TagA/CpsF family glycosyltransferase n=1 Tax=Tuberibacillus sp. Marseille-P3662 TaxID=1965358 RepID=UPI000A1C9640|nr:WecB/TagA/CpsF family glycosyltransferase [Tuberibacillus sp. Marseille-P3662]